MSKALSHQWSWHKQEARTSEKNESVNMGQNNPSHFVSFPYLYQKFHFIRGFTNNIILINGGIISMGSGFGQLKKSYTLPYTFKSQNGAMEL